MEQSLHFSLKAFLPTRQAYISVRCPFFKGQEMNEAPDSPLAFPNSFYELTDCSRGAVFQAIAGFSYFLEGSARLDYGDFVTLTP
jgi:hypothetical protein